MAPHSSTLAWKIPWMEEPDRLQSMGSLQVGQDWATSFSLFTFHFPALEKEMATHSSVLAWRIPGTAEPGGLPSLGLHRVRHDWSNLAAAAAAFTGGFPGGAGGKEPTCQCKRCGFDPWVEKIPWRRAWQPTPVFLPGENSLDRGARQATIHRVAKNWTWLKQLSMHTGSLHLLFIHTAVGVMFCPGILSWADWGAKASIMCGPCDNHRERREEATLAKHCSHLTIPCLHTLMISTSQERDGVWDARWRDRVGSHRSEVWI